MELTIGKLREIIKDLPDDMILAHLGVGNNNFIPFIEVKRVMVFEEQSEHRSRKYLTINSLGSHFTKAGRQEDLVYIGPSFDETILKS